MKTEKKILIAFLLNLLFSLFEFVGGIFTGSVSILSDAIHDLGDAFSIGLSFFLEKKSKRQPDDIYTYGYGRYSALGGALTALFLVIGSGIVLYHAVSRIINPTEINYDGMILFAIVGLCVNFCAAFITRKGESLNQKAVNLHMLEDVLEWAAVLAGAVIMRFTDIALLDPLLSIAVALFILVNAVRHLKEAVLLFLESAPKNAPVSQIKPHLCGIDGVVDVHHIHIWSLDEHTTCATLHIVTNEDHAPIKNAVREKLKELGVAHATLELEAEGETCPAAHCRMEHTELGHHHHHHHH